MKALHGGKAKHDPIDSQKIAAWLRGGMLPQADVYPPERRATRDLLRRRTHLMRQRAELLAHVQHTHRQYNLPDIGKKIAYPATREGVAQRFDEAAVQKTIEIAPEVLTGPRHLVRNVLSSDQQMALTPPTWIEAVDRRVEADGKVGRLHNGPSQSRMAVLAVAPPFDRAVAQPLTPHPATIGGKIANGLQARHRPRVPRHRQGQDRAHAGDGLAPGPLGLGLHWCQHRTRLPPAGRFPTPQKVQVARESESHVGVGQATGELSRAEVTHPFGSERVARIGRQLGPHREH